MNCNNNTVTGINTSALSRNETNNSPITTDLPHVVQDEMKDKFIGKAIFPIFGHHSALFPSERNEFFFKDCELLRYYSTIYKSLPYNKIYGCIFYILDDSLISEISSWILKHVVL